MLPSKAWVSMMSAVESHELQWLNTFTMTSIPDEWGYGWKENHSVPVTGYYICAYYDNDPEHPGLQDASCETPDIPAICYIPYQK